MEHVLRLIHVSDLADIHLKFLNNRKIKNKSLIVNCGYGKGYSVKEVVDIFKSIKKNVVVSYKKRRKGDIEQIFANTQKLKKILNWKPKFDNMKEIISSSINGKKR